MFLIGTGSSPTQRSSNRIFAGEKQLGNGVGEEPEGGAEAICDGVPNRGGHGGRRRHRVPLRAAGACGAGRAGEEPLPLVQCLDARPHVQAR